MMDPVHAITNISQQLLVLHWASEQRASVLHVEMHVLM